VIDTYGADEYPDPGFVITADAIAPEVIIAVAVAWIPP
jgi:hypothetical protein